MLWFSLDGRFHCFVSHPLTAPGDYRSINSVATIPAGRTQTFVEIRIEVDYDIENMERFQVTLSNPSEGALIHENIATISIIDVDSKFLSLKNIQYILVFL